jgi:hypothetical protein
MHPWISCLALVLISCGCANTALHPVAADPVQVRPARPAITADTADVVVTTFDAPIKVRVGQTIGLKPMGPGERWQVSFSDDALELLTSYEQLEKPGEAGWVWRALRVGEIPIELTSSPPCAERPCAPNVQKYAVTLEVSK